LLTPLTFMITLIRHLTFSCKNQSKLIEK